MKKLENYLLHVNKRQKKMIYLSILLVIGFLMNAISTPMLEEYENQQSQIESLQTSIATNSSNRIKKEIAEKSKLLMGINAEIEKQKEHITFLMSSLYKLKYAFFNEKEFASSLDEILKKSVNARLHIEHIKTLSLPKENAEKILKHRKRLEIKGFGGYKEIVAFIAHIESLDVLSTFETIQMDAGSDHVKFKLIVDIFGIGL